MRRGSAEVKKRALRWRAARTRAPPSRASLLSSGSWRLFFTWADCVPAVARPSDHGARSRTARNSPTSRASRTSGIGRIISPSSVVQLEADLDVATRTRHGVARVHALVDLRVEEVEHRELHRVVLLLPGDHRVAARIARHRVH